MEYKNILAMGRIWNNSEVRQNKQKELESRFSYLTKEERDKLLYGTDFVKVPTEELKRLRIDVYPYLM